MEKYLVHRKRPISENVFRQGKKFIVYGTYLDSY